MKRLLGLVRPPFLATVVAGLSVGCGRSWIYPPFEAVIESGTSTSGGGTSSGSSGGHSSGSTTGPGTSGSGTTGRASGSGSATGTTSAAASGSSTGASGSNSSGSSGGCVSAADCPALDTICVARACAPNPCAQVQFDRTCNAVAVDDGSCVPTQGAGSSALCFQGGTATTFCDPGATRADLDRACVAGMYCLPGPAGGVCALLCNPVGPNSCPRGACVVPIPANPLLGVCAPGSSSTGGTSGGSSSGGSTTGGTAGGCSTVIPPSEFQSCATVADCGCPLTCVADAAAGGAVCEYPCQSLSDCPDVVTLCNGAVCAVNQCGPPTANGTFNALCNATGSGDGTCLPFVNSAGQNVGYCYQGGSSKANCDPLGSRSDLSRVCVPGQICFGGAVNFGGTCNVICDPNVGGPCPPQQFCSFIVNEPDLGICISPNGP